MLYANDTALQMEVTLFLHREARLLDDQDYGAWLDLLSDDIEYWIPNSREQEDPIFEASITYENKQLLQFRVDRLSHPHAHSLARMPRSTHLISNILIDEKRSSAGDLVVGSNFLTLGYQEDANNTQTLYGGTQTHHLSKVDGDYRITKKKIVLNNLEAPHGNLQIIL
jgi:3-phenylpropionate/cinnamic acid dioxygenase small subunit